MFVVTASAIQWLEPHLRTAAGGELMREILRQSNDPEVEAGLKEVRPFFWFLTLVLLFLYGLTLFGEPALRQTAKAIPYTLLFLVHIAVHWHSPRLTIHRQWLVVYSLVQIILVVALIAMSRQDFLIVGLYSALAGESIGQVADWRRSLVIILGYLLLMALTYGFIWGWATAPDWLGTAVLSMLFVLIYVLLFMRQLNARAESQRLLEELQAAHAQLAEYAQRVERLTLEAERQRMARELHDTLAQGLAGLVLQLEALEASLERDRPAQAAQIAGQAKERARLTLAEARRAIEDLRTAETAVAEAVSTEVERFSTATGMPCTVEMPAELTLPDGLGEHVVRCVSEGLANVTRHAQARQVWLTIGQERGWLHVQIRDDGRGFDAAATIPAGHYGLLGLRERARLAGGKLAVESQPGQGTTLVMSLPLA